MENVRISHISNQDRQGPPITVMNTKTTTVEDFRCGNVTQKRSRLRCCGRRPSSLVPRLAVAVFSFRRIRHPWRAADGHPRPSFASVLGPRRLRHTPPISGPSAAYLCTCAGAGVQAPSSCLLRAPLAAVWCACAWRRGCAWLRRPAAPRRPFRARRVAGASSVKKRTASAALIAGQASLPPFRPQKAPLRSSLAQPAA